MQPVTIDKAIRGLQTENDDWALPAKAGNTDMPTDPGSVDFDLHRFRSLLNVIIGYSELMLDDMLGRLTEEQRDGLKDILTSGLNLMSIVNQSANR